MKRSQWLGVITVIMLAWNALAAATDAQDLPAPQRGGIPELQEQISDLELKLLRSEAEADELKEEERLLKATPEGAEPIDSPPVKAPEVVWEKLFDVAGSDDSEEVLKQLELAKNHMKKYRDASINVWKWANEQSLELQRARARTEDDIGRQAGGKEGASALTAELIGGGVLAVLGGLVLLGHEIRDRLRWRLRAVGSRPSLLLVGLILPFAVVCAAGSAPVNDAAGPKSAVDATGGTVDLAKELARKRDKLRQRFEDEQQVTAAARRRLTSDFENVRHQRAAHSMEPDTPKFKRIVEQAEASEAKIQESFQELRVAARVAARALNDAELTKKKLTNEVSALNGFVLGSKGKANSVSLIRLVTCGLFILAAVVPISLVRRGRRRERHEQARKCPRCLNKDTLDFITSSSDAEFDEGQTMFRLKVCNACQYEIRENYVDQNRLCFPTVGIRATGKTHWLLMLYDQIKNSNIPVASTIKKIPSREDARFDELVQRLLYAGGRLDPTVWGGFPYPLTFHVHDSDRLGPNKSMVNVFDYSGEMRNFDIDTNEFRRRALLCEGFTLFLDPTQVSAGSISAIESQIECLTKFAEEMHAIRGIATEKPIDLPIAVCISKIDLLVTKSPLGTQAIPLVTALRETMTRKVDLSLIHERSQLCARVMPQLFPGWNVERSLGENFGGRYMFFPMSAVGLEEAELGVEDLSQRMIAPCGMIEPLLWLLHMHGYCVFH